MAFYVLKNNGKVVDVISDDSAKLPDVNKLFLEGKIDAIEKVANFDDVKDIFIKMGFVAPEGIQSDESKLEQLIRKITKGAEGIATDLFEKLETLKKQSSKDIGNIADRAKSAGQDLLKEIREIHNKAVKKAKKK